MRATVFQDNPPHKPDFKDIVNHQCTLLHVRIGQETQVVLVRSLNPNHHQNNSILLFAS